MTDGELRAWLREALERHSTTHPDAAQALTAVTVELASTRASGHDLRDRRRRPWHVTASAIVVDGEDVLLVRHRALGRWLQPGGHLAENEAPWEGAAREAREETGVQGHHAFAVNGTPEPVDVDLHGIPASPAKEEPAHRHLDLRFVVVADGRAVAPTAAGLDEVSDVRWVPLGLVATGASNARGLTVDRSLQRAATAAARLLGDRGSSSTTPPRDEP